MQAPHTLAYTAITLINHLDSCGINALGVKIGGKRLHHVFHVKPQTALANGFAIYYHLDRLGQINQMLVKIECETAAPGWCVMTGKL